jgi:hypothetical protein
MNATTTAPTSGRKMIRLRIGKEERSTASSYRAAITR